jgi:hypothetical protein
MKIHAEMNSYITGDFQLLPLKKDGHLNLLLGLLQELEGRNAVLLMRDDLHGTLI